MFVKHNTNFTNFLYMWGLSNFEHQYIQQSSLQVVSQAIKDSWLVSKGIKRKWTHFNPLPDILLFPLKISSTWSLKKTHFK